MIPKTQAGSTTPRLGFAHPGSTSHTRADMHCHSTASELAKLGIQRSVGLPECATPPEEVYELAKSRGMDFVTITDHDTIAGCLELADRPDVFISEELTTWFADEPQAVHVLCYGITPEDHEFLQAHAGDLETCAAYLHEHEITCALAHPFFHVAAPLTARHRRRLAQLFPVWEVRNGSRARELNMPAAVYIETHGGTGIGGSDDHAGVDIGRTYTETRARVLAGTVSGAHPRGPRRVGREPGQRRQVGARRARVGHRSLIKCRGSSVRDPRPTGSRRVRRRRCARDRRAGRGRRRGAWGRGGGEPRLGGGHGPAESLARLGRPSGGPRRADRADEGRRLQPLGPVPPGEADPRAQAAGGG